jgi:ATP-binding cassette subfamily C protein
MSDAPTRRQKGTADTLGILMRLLGEVAPLRLPMLAAIVFGIAANLCVIFIPVLGGVALASVAGLTGLTGAAGTVGTVVGTAGVAGLPSPVALMALIASCALGRTAFRYVEQLLGHYVAFRLLALMRSKVFTALRGLAPAKLEGHDKGELIALITSDIELLEVFYAHTVSPVAIAAAICAAMTVFMGLIYPLLALIAALAYAVVGILVPRRYLALTAKPGKEVREGLGRLGAYFHDSLRGLEQTIQYGGTKERLASVKGMSEALGRQLERLRWLEARGGALSLLAVLSFSVAVFLVAIILYGLGAIDGADVIVSTLAMMSSFGPVLALASLSHGLAQTTGAARRLFALLDEAPAVDEVTGGVDVGFSGAAFESVGFSYAEGVLSDEDAPPAAAVPSAAAPSAAAPSAAASAPPASTSAPPAAASAPHFENIDFTNGSERIFGIAGRSGSGKSTLIKLLMRFWDVDTGRLAVSGHDIKGINTAALRDMQSYLTQDTQLLNMSLRDNILIARPTATQDELERACEKAAILSFIKGLPQGFDTVAGELGERLSGGERQRIGLARAFLHDASLMILDEPTSSLDSLNEAAILGALHKGRDGKTVVLVSHRESTMRIADEVYELVQTGDSGAR